MVYQRHIPLMLLDPLLDLLFPGACVGCHAPLARGARLCPACREDIRPYRTLFCGVCNARLPDGRRICHRDGAYIYGAAADYRDARVRALVHEMKFRYARVAARSLAPLMVACARDILPPRIARRAFVVPVPLAAARERRRGFNQARLLAEPIAEALGLPLAPDLIVRVRHTLPQSELTDAERRRANVAACFAPAPRAALPARAPIILVDDVRTSGATLAEAAAALKAGGAGTVIALVAARA